MAFSLNINFAPLAALFGNRFGTTNSVFPADGTGTSINFTTIVNSESAWKPGTAAEGNTAGISLNFSGGTVKLYLPQNMTIQYAANYQETEMSMMIKSAMDNGLFSSETGSSIMAAAQQSATSAIGSFTGITGVEAGANLALNRVKNSHMEVMFQGMAFRQFQFEFKFFPRNKAEADSIRGIIKHFKFHMHPEYKGSKDWFLPPSQFKIGVQGGNGIYGGFKEAALVDMSVNFTGAGVQAQFEDGNPAEIDLSLTFKELKYNTKEDIAMGAV